MQLYQTLSSTTAAAVAMKIITQLVILTLSLLLVNAHDDHYCDNLYRNFTDKCKPSILTIKSCCELKIFSTDYAPSGVYRMSKGSFDNTVNVYCDMVTDGGGWIIIQRNKVNSPINFKRNWTDYEKGFGDLNSEFWYGLESMHCLTQRGQWEMRVDYQKNDKTWSHLYYSQFSVGSANEEYPLTVGGYSGSLSSHHALYYNRMKFTTADNDNDERSGGNCAAIYKSGYWYKNCFYVDLNQQPPIVNPSGSMIFTEMKIHPKGCITQ